MAESWSEVGNGIQEIITQRRCCIRSDKGSFETPDFICRVRDIIAVAFASHFAHYVDTIPTMVVLTPSGHGSRWRVYCHLNREAKTRIRNTIEKDCSYY